MTLLLSIHFKTLVNCHKPLSFFFRFLPLCLLNRNTCKQKRKSRSSEQATFIAAIVAMKSSSSHLSAQRDTSQFSSLFSSLNTMNIITVESSAMNIELNSSTLSVTPSAQLLKLPSAESTFNLDFNSDLITVTSSTAQINLFSVSNLSSLNSIIRKRSNAMNKYSSKTQRTANQELKMI